MDRNKIIRCVDISKEDAAFLLEEQEPVKHGRWITEDGVIGHCSNCDYEPFAFEHTLYCPNCGARMDEEGGNDKP